MDRSGKPKTMGGLEADLARRHRRYGWTALFLALSFGAGLEALHGYKVAEYLLDPLRREFWSLAHFHGGLLALVNLIYVRWAESDGLSGPARNRASWLLILGSALMPLGFFFGGLIHYEGDPGLGIFLAPLGALCILVAAGFQVRDAWRR